MFLTWTITGLIFTPLVAGSKPYRKLIKSEQAVPSLTAIGTLIKSINPGWSMWAKMGIMLPTRDTKPNNRLMVTSSSYFGGGVTPGCSS